MPSHEVHRKVEELVFGRSFPKVDRAIDAPFLIMGRGHRKLFHDYLTAAYVSYVVCGDPLPGVLHLTTDRLCSKDHKLKQFLKYWIRLKR